MVEAEDVGLLDFSTNLRVSNDTIDRGVKSIDDSLAGEKEKILRYRTGRPNEFGKVKKLAETQSIAVG